MSKSVLVVLMALCVTTAVAEPLKIIGFETGSGITFQGATVSNYYTLEFAMSPGGPWTNWGSITDQPVTGTVMAVPSPFFYRIRQTESSAFPPYALVGHTHSNITAAMLDPDQVVKSINQFRDDVTIVGGANVTVSTNGNGLGISAASIPNMEVINTSGTFTVPSGVTRIMVEVWGGGGGGGAGYNPSGTQGGGGGGGGYGKQVFTVSAGANYTVSVGNGGAGSTGSGALAGGTSSFGALISASGGSPGTDAGATKGAGGTGGTSAALVNLPGEAGNQFSSSGPIQSQAGGGASPYGGSGGVGGMVAVPGGAPGGGGGGGGAFPEGWPGGDGAKGRVIVYY